ncbi:hypothetical protein BAE30_15915 [Acidithiobacillus caldus]|uniref:Uncharacterized protein n=1 Tax=Acidithiobacillus caldus TaxID=33059 RepID=A0A1E7YS09_9PROT|nr:hypothetical protein BAE30_15915 [Acidithiobacillus caldus]
MPGTSSRHGDTNQLGRRNLSDYQRAEVALLLEGLFRGQARERQLATLKQNADVPNLAPRDDTGKTRTAIAQVAGVSHGTIDKVKAIQRDAIAIVTATKWSHSPCRMSMIALQGRIRAL